MSNLTFTAEAELVGRIILSAALGGVLGWERQLGQQPAGLRTHMLVSIGAAAYTLAGTFGVAGLGTNQDPGRVAAQIVTGIGFIGAGTIWRSSGDDRIIRGLTTAASVWVAASIGMLCGFGLYVLAAGCALVSFVVLRLLRGLERLPAAVWGRINLQEARTLQPPLEPPPAFAPQDAFAREPETVPPASDILPEEPDAEDLVPVGNPAAETQPDHAAVARAAAARRAGKKERRKKGGGKKGGKGRRRAGTSADQPDIISDP